MAGSDPSGGAGLQADLKTFHRLGVYGEAVVTLITVQNTRGVTRVEVLAPDLVVDPVMISKNGAPLMDEAARRAFAKCMVRRAFLLTPNLQEAEALAGFPVRDVSSMRRAAEALVSLGASHVLVKGGHLEGDAVDVLFTPGEGFTEFREARIETRHTHGTGCTYSAAITAELAKGVALKQAVAAGKAFLTEAIRTNPGLGGGAGPLNHHAQAKTQGH